MAQSSFAPAQAQSQPSAAASFINLHHLSYALPDGRVLLDAVSHDFAVARHGLIGRNGTGKSVLLRILQGSLSAQSGRVARLGRIAYVAQTHTHEPGATLAEVAGIGDILVALSNIEAGSTNPADFDLADGHWRIQDDWARMLDDAGLPAWAPDHPARAASGGKLTRVALAGALLQGADGLLLDEPSNHLDARARGWLMEKISTWRGGLIVVSHDRTLLNAMQHIVELDRGTLTGHAGNYSAYRTQRDLQAAAADAALAHARNERAAGLRALRQQHDAQLQRSARNARQARASNQAPILLGMKKANAEGHAGRERLRRQQTSAALEDAVTQAAARALAAPGVALALPETVVPSGRRVLHMEDAVPPYPANAKALTLSLSGPFRLAVHGPNGCGKSTLLSMLAGEIDAKQGTCDVRVPTAMLDQRAAGLPLGQSLLTTLETLGASLPEGELRSRLALLGLGPALVDAPAETLSGGERVKAALACALWRKQPAQLLLLDEPTNHLDITSAEALEQALRQYPGAMVAVSHDTAFLEAIAPTHRLIWGDDAVWELRAR
ncbi:ABC transporter [Achromobacter marplatensis]|uniref:ATPase subunit of ABC transporter with duplicated ATPase domains n=1 Tax=Achromobacter marplatensis TaxID=470868 RepID=A0ABX9G7T6_9BURK|nr:ABC-F family ATP-binding cassette domain-containing protein [Achromobacter marplatensis]OWT65900.1 ABC transporter [Achromobacter marplatensis]RBP18734.1 ATPase subunit of ABC transporter with duplicated ATPase domains [Achromobacter marplatensis]CAB3666896.1 Energy-dependent translational throttle protein EttA [Achromobacter marplatensis]